MAPKLDLRLSEPITSEPEEEYDIGEYTSIASGSTILTNRTTASGSTGGPTPVVIFTQPYHRQIETLSPPRMSFTSPSSPDLSKVKVDRPRGLSRSNTLPRLFQPEQKARRKSSDIDDLVVDSEVVAKIRRWILGITIGMDTLMHFLQLDGPDKYSLQSILTLTLGQSLVAYIHL